MTDLVFNFQADQKLAESITGGLASQEGAFSYRKFPDGESYYRIEQDVGRKSVAVLADLGHPDEKFLALALFAETLRDLGAARIGLVAPYLPYMRQDRQFNAGEGVTSRYFARLVSDLFDWLVTVEPHLHRYHDLGELYSIPAVAVSAAPAIADWIRHEIDKPQLIGPDSESEQWVREVAELADAPYIIMQKVRRGDRDVEISAPGTGINTDLTPVLVDDIVSSGNTMLETIDVLAALGYPSPICIAVHGLFTESSYNALLSRATRVMTTNTIPHASNAIMIDNLVVNAVNNLTSG